MKKCQYCGMSNASTSIVCFNCWGRLEEVKDEANVGVGFPEVIATDPLLNAASRQGEMVHHARHDRTLTSSTVMLLGVLTFLLLLEAGLQELSLLALVGTIISAGLFKLYKRSTRDN